MQGLSHMTFIVHDLEKATLFFETILDAKEVYASGDETYSLSREKFFLIGDLWIAIMEGESLPSRTYNHIAFKIENDAYDMYSERIERLGLEVKEGRARVDGEARSIYFYDFDNHLFELHTGTLAERLREYEKE
ncbi:FosX/FosE/FosI family fosfomycin resistance hydrolase [Listeria booriae]|uniref:FosX/FosE/FosI family fosfomycin resistance thiol transferase n=1 Tax=Listeria booriae TaxID=1552123 RepID=A0A7X0ZWY9_9LIST|nr:FosX/FosE/FosI family fosfomycin resistance hydrolase [Listeria booriae]MBC2283650.1 FosX/FosE/FosI family fosfomycin resistance thiol transferase [Listeria booriae]MBC2293223.1 FosX/FosE/FosI family fosfomycin resistance thiol transferase [Listeria booriae]MBC2303576.1 FosX/FosE/FosI family fosfomycin resistance thiol transferase [Listeria booriae]MBC2312003.1 FosX/FosE/FosI family fosfomycin resistance thiol transferase [Listeria booriae]